MKKMILALLLVGSSAFADQNIISIGMVPSNGKPEATTSGQGTYNTEFMLMYQRQVADKIFVGLSVGTNTTKMISIGYGF